MVMLSRQMSTALLFNDVNDDFILIRFNELIAPWRKAIFIKKCYPKHTFIIDSTITTIKVYWYMFLRGTIDRNEYKGVSVRSPARTKVRNNHTATKSRYDTIKSHYNTIMSRYNTINCFQNIHDSRSITRPWRWEMSKVGSMVYRIGSGNGLVPSRHQAIT